MDFKSKIRVIEDFPQPGVRFKDITTLLKDGTYYQAAIDRLAEYALSREADVVVGPEARGFVIGAPIAYKLGKGFVPVRKSGKLPSEAVEADYELEYGQDRLALHTDAIERGQKVLVADDLLATGGTIATTIRLIESLGGVVVGCSFLIELTALKGREKLEPDYDIFALVQY